MTSAQFAMDVSSTITHEVGHSLGLVDPKWLPAIEDGRQWLHNLERSRVKIMDAGGIYYVKHRLNPSSTLYWKTDNLRYIRFILPKE